MKAGLSQSADRERENKITLRLDGKKLRGRKGQKCSGGGGISRKQLKFKRKRAGNRSNIAEELTLRIVL